MGFRIVGLELDGPLIARRGVVEPVLLLQDVPQVVVGIGIVGLEVDGLLETRRSLVEPALSRELDPQVVLDLGVDGLEPGRLVMARHDLVEPSLVPEDITQVERYVGQVGSEPHHIPKPCARAGGSNLFEEVSASGDIQHSSRRRRQYGKLAEIKHTRGHH